MLIKNIEHLFASDWAANRYLRRIVLKIGWSQDGGFSKAECPGLKKQLVSDVRKSYKHLVDGHVFYTVLIHYHRLDGNVCLKLNIKCNFHHRRVMFERTASDINCYDSYSILFLSYSREWKSSCGNSFVRNTSHTNTN